MNTLLKTGALLLAAALPLSASETWVVGNQPIGTDVIALEFDATTGTLFGSTGTHLVRIDPTTRAGTLVGPFGFVLVSQLAFDANSGTLYGLSSNKLLLSIDPLTGAGSPIGPLAIGTINQYGLAFDENTDTLYGIRQSSWPGTSVYRIDVTTGALTLLGSVNTGNSCVNTGTVWVSGVTFEESSGSLYVVARRVDGSYAPYDEVLLRVDPVALTGGVVSFAYCGLNLALSGIAFDSNQGVLYGASRVPGSPWTYLVDVDPLTGLSGLLTSVAPGADFGDLQSAINTASAGDRIHILPGSYEPFALDKPLSLEGSPGGWVRIEFPSPYSDPTSPGMVSVSVTGTATTSIAGLRAPAITVDGCGGTVFLSDIESSSVSITNSADVRAHRVVVSASQFVVDPVGGGISASNALEVYGSRVEIVDSTVRGGPGFCYQEYGFWSCNSGGDAIVLGAASNTLLHVARSDIIGGPPGTFPGGSGGGGLGLRILRGNVVLSGTPADQLQANNAPAAALSSGASLRYSGITVSGSITGAGTVIAPSEPDPVLEPLGPLQTGAPLAFAAHGAPGASLTVLLGSSPSPAGADPFINPLVIPIRGYDLGTLDATGQATMTIPALPGLPVGSLLLAQAEVTNPDGTLLRSNSAFPVPCGASGLDCNANGEDDACDVYTGTSADCNANAIPDECEADCNGNGVADECDVDSGVSFDCNGNGIPDECEPDCNGNGVVDECDFWTGVSQDCNANGIPDECDIASGAGFDCNANGVPDQCDLATGVSLDCNANGIPDDCEPDCDGDGVPDVCEIAAGALDLNANGVPDECETLNFSYCTAKPNSDGCTPLGLLLGTPSASAATAFSVDAFLVNAGQNGLLLYGLSGPDASPFVGGTLCVQPPVRRTPLQNSGAAYPCGGTFSFDFNAWIQGGNDPLIGVGSQVNAQYWYRDPGDPFGVGLTDAVEFFVGP